MELYVPSVYLPVPEHLQYVHTAKYIFTDVTPHNARFLKGSVLFDDDLAEKVIREFAQYKEGCEALLVHCLQGKNRSPAIGIALNEIFDLGHDTHSLLKQYNKLNKHVYETMLKARDKLIKNEP